MTSVYNLLREACAISQAEAAEHVHRTRLDTVKSWSSDRRPAPDWAINHLQSLCRRIHAAGTNYATMLKRQSPGGKVYALGISINDDDARWNGFPSLGAQRQALAIAISQLPDDAEIHIVSRVGGAIPVPVLAPEKVEPTETDSQVLQSMSFEGGNHYTAGNMNRRKFERLEQIGWLTHHCPNLSDVEYSLTDAGRVQLAIEDAAELMRKDPDPMGGGDMQRVVTAGPRRGALLKLKPQQKYKMGELSFTVEKIDGNVVTVQLAGSGPATLHADPVLLPPAPG